MTKKFIFAFVLYGVVLTSEGKLHFCAYHPAAPGSNPKHTIHAFSKYIFIKVVCGCDGG